MDDAHYLNELDVDFLDYLSLGIVKKQSFKTFNKCFIIGFMLFCQSLTAHMF